MIQTELFINICLHQFDCACEQVLKIIKICSLEIEFLYHILTKFMGVSSEFLRLLRNIHVGKHSADTISKEESLKKPIKSLYDSKMLRSKFAVKS